MKTLIIIQELCEKLYKNKYDQLRMEEELLVGLVKSDKGEFVKIKAYARIREINKLQLDFLQIFQDRDSMIEQLKSPKYFTGRHVHKINNLLQRLSINDPARIEECLIDCHKFIKGA